MDSFLCPHCSSQLKIGEQIIFSTQNSHKQKGLVILSSKVGDYSCSKHYSYEFFEGEKIDFHCPICSKNLISKIHPNLCVVHYEDSRLNQYQVYFSNIVGEKCTYILSDDTFESHGKDCQKYIELFSK